MSRIIGIDLGTTNSCVAVLDEKGQPTTLVAADGERTAPSWVAWAPDGGITVGTRAPFSFPVTIEPLLANWNKANGRVCEAGEARGRRFRCVE